MEGCPQTWYALAPAAAARRKLSRLRQPACRTHRVTTCLRTGAGEKLLASVASMPPHQRLVLRQARVAALLRTRQFSLAQVNLLPCPPPPGLDAPRLSLATGRAGGHGSGHAPQHTVCTSTLPSQQAEFVAVGDFEVAEYRYEHHPQVYADKKGEALLGAASCLRLAATRGGRVGAFLHRECWLILVRPCRLLRALHAADGEGAAASMHD